MLTTYERRAGSCYNTLPALLYRLKDRKEGLHDFLFR